jgi:hypothetical protein
VQSKKCKTSTRTGPQECGALIAPLFATGPSRRDQKIAATAFADRRGTNNFEVAIPNLATAHLLKFVSMHEEIFRLIVYCITHFDFEYHATIYYEKCC